LDWFKALKTCFWLDQGRAGAASPWTLPFPPHHVAITQERIGGESAAGGLDL
jgi:hypothetical protein